MRLLNLGSGSVRPQDEFWTNLDDLHSQLPLGSPERTNLDEEKNYVNHDIGSGPLPFEDNTFDGIVCSHVIEHFDCMQGVNLMGECNRILKSGGCLIVSVPDCAYFRKVNANDSVENAVELFGEPIHLPDGEETFFGYALWMWQHKAILNEDSLWCYFVRAGFPGYLTKKLEDARFGDNQSLQVEEIKKIINREKFSIIMVSQKIN